MSGLERLPDRAVVEEIKRRAAEEAELKGSFQSFGSDSVIAHRIFSQSTYDFQFTASPTPGTVIVHRANIEFIPDDMTFGGAFCHRVMARVLDSSNNVAEYFDPPILRRRTSDGKQKWSIYHVSFGSPADTIRLKLFFFTTGSGTFTANVIS